MISKFFTRPIAFHAPLVDLAGSINAGLMLSQAIYWRNKTKDTDGWFYKTANDWHQETRMTRREQEGARKNLMRLQNEKGEHVWEEKLCGVPAKLYFRINESVLDELLLAMPDGDDDGGEIVKQDSTKGEIQFSQIGETGFDKKGNLYTESTTENTTDIFLSPESPQQDALISDADIKPSNPVKAPKKEPKQSTEQQIWFDAICKTVGWDYHVITKEQIGQVAQTVGVLQKAGYTIDDLRAFYKSWFESDWRGKQGQRPTLTQVRSEIGKLKADAVPAPVVDSRLNRIAILS